MSGYILGLISLFLVASSDAALRGGPYSIAPMDINGGGTHATGGAYTLIASTGQGGGLGVIGSGVYKLSNGFYPPAASMRGNFDDDGDVDLSDFAFFAACFSGTDNPAPSTPPGCLNSDLDGDGDVDLDDFLIFVGHYWMFS